MAELHRGARRYDLHLSGPQVVGIVVGTLVTLSLAFGIGVGFGRRLATAEPVLKVGPEPSAAKVEAPDAGSHDFTYQTELTKSDPPPPPRAVTPPAAVKPSTATVAPPPAPTPLPAAAAEIAVDAGTPTVIIGAPRTVSAHAAEPVDAEEPPPAKAAAASPPKPVATHPTPAPKVEESGDHFTVQFTATVNQSDADRFAKKLKEAGYSPSVVAAEVPGKGRLFRVRAGHFPTKEAAESFREQALSKHQFAGMVMPTN
jgi:cell division septation protein DedD